MTRTVRRRRRPSRRPSSRSNDYAPLLFRSFSFSLRRADLKRDTLESRGSCLYGTLDGECKQGFSFHYVSGRRGKREMMRRAT